MVYCVSDIHGCYDKFHDLLKLINLKSDDTLWVLGDAIDRGPDSVKCLQYIMGVANIKMLMGNHEWMMLYALTSSDERDRMSFMSSWAGYNGGSSTYRQFKMLSLEEQTRVICFLRELPYYEIIKLGSRKFILVHAGLNCVSRQPRERLSLLIKQHQEDNFENMVWIREDFISHKALPSYRIIFGHTPTAHMYGNGRMEIWRDPIHKDKVGIDCGCVFDGKLAALRLDDMKEFYI